MMNRRLRVFALATATLVATALAAPLAQAAPPAFGSYIVQVSKGSNAAVEARAKSLGGTIGFRYDVVLNGFSVTLPAAAADALAKTPGVTSIEADGVMSIDAVSPQLNATWGLDRIDQRDLPLSTTYAFDREAAGVYAFIIDTGMNLTHTDFTGRVATDLDRDFVSNDLDASDCNGHGTHVAGTVGGTKYGVAKGVTLVPIRVLDCNGSGTTSGVVAGIDYAASVVDGWAKSSDPALNTRRAVANMSLGGGASSTLDTSVTNAVAKGIVMAVAAGNSNTDACTSSPARAASAITVGATASNDARASYSNYGTCLDVFAPGSSITSDWYTSNTATNTISGTSMATPHVAGVAALLRAANPSSDPAAIATALVSMASQNRVGSAGTGSPNRLLYYGGATDNPPALVVAPSAVQNLSLAKSNSTPNTVVASWTAGSSGGTPTSYTVTWFRSSSGKSYSRFATTTVSNSPSTATATSGYYYIVQVYATNSAGNSSTVQSTAFRMP